MAPDLTRLSEGSATEVIDEYVAEILGEGIREVPKPELPSAWAWYFEGQDGDDGENNGARLPGIVESPRSARPEADKGYDGPVRQNGVPELWRESVTGLGLAVLSQGGV